MDSNVLKHCMQHSVLCLVLRILVYTIYLDAAVRFLCGIVLDASS